MSTTPLAAPPSIASGTKIIAPDYPLTHQLRQQFFFLTIPGIIRILEALLSSLHIGGFGYFGTYYDKIVDEVVSPHFMASSRETFFLLINCNTFITSIHIIMASIISVRSHASLLGSLFMFIFDFVQFLLMLSASIGLLLLYHDKETRRIYGAATQTRQGLAVTGILLAFLHLIGCIYDLGIYVRRSYTELRTAQNQTSIS